MDKAAVNNFVNEMRNKINAFKALSSVSKEDRRETLLYVQAIIDNAREDLKG